MVILVQSTKNPLGTYKAPSLSPRETEVLATLDREKRPIITLDELADRFGRNRAYEIVRSLVRKGVLHRLDRGLYRAHPVRALGRGHAVSGVVAATHILRAEDHYFGGWWAWSFHGLTRQVHGSRIDAFVTRSRPPRTLENARLFFHRIPAGKLEYGVQICSIENVAVRTSDLERTLLDALDHPALLGSISVAVERVANVLEKAELRRIVSYAARGSRVSTCLRLAVLLERQGASPRSLSPLFARTRESESVLSLLPDRPRTGRVHPKWHVVENDGRFRG